MTHGLLIQPEWRLVRSSKPILVYRLITSP